MSDPTVQALFLFWVIVWSIWGTCLLWELQGYTITRGSLALLIIIAGPAIWGISLYRGLYRARRAIMRRFGVEGMGCQCQCGHRH